MTDNITPQAPQTKAPMTTEEIIRRLREVKAVYKVQTTGMFTADTAGGDMDAMDAAIRAVTALEEIKKELHNECCACTHHDCPTYEDPCRDCFDGNDHWAFRWAFRWPLGEETNHEMD